MKIVRFVLLVYFFILLFTSVSGSSRVALAGPDLEKKDISVRWAFGALTGPENNRKLISITKDTSLKTNDQFKMMVELRSRCYVYLIYSGSNGEIQILFPSDIGQFSKSIPLSEKYYIPQGELWFALDEQTGLETFYLLISKNRLSELENLLKTYEALNSDQKPEMARQIVNQMKKLKRKHKTLAAPAERPVQIGGTLRNIKNRTTSTHDIASLAVEISAPEFYSRTFTIEHQ